jgi:PAS domain S-box-containing protein
MPLWKSVKEKIWKAWQATIENWLLHHAHLCATVCALFAVLFLSIGFIQARLLSGLSAQLVSNPTEATPHKFGGLEAFVLDGFKGRVVPSSLPPSVAVAASAVDQALNGQSADVENITLHVNPPGSQDLRSQYISDDNKEVFLFIPAFVLANLRTSPRPFENSITLSTLGIPSTSMLSHDISAGISARDALKKVLTASSDSDPSRSFTQVYLVSATGALRDYNDGGSDNNSFIAHRFFPERPYFWPTLEHHTSEVDCPAPFSFCTRPYVDLGGHGIVVTMCRVAGTGANISDTVLCADIGYPTTETKQTIAEEIGPVSANPPREVVCHVAGANVQCDESTSDSAAEQVQMSSKAVLESKRSEEMLGGIYKLYDKQQSSPITLSQVVIDWIGKIPYLGKPIQGLYPLKGESSFKFTVPLKVERVSGAENIRFLLCSVDFAFPTLLLTLSVTGGTIFIVGLFVSIFYSFQARRKSFEFIASLEDVMKASPIPFVHLNEEGKITGANDAFQKLMGLSLNELQNERFYSLMDLPSQARYDVVAQCRRNKLLTRPYEITLLKKSGQPEPVVVSGSALDMPRTSEFKISEPAATFLHTFGIVIPRTDISDSEFQRVGVLSKDLPQDVFTQLLTGSAHAV